MKPDLKKLLMRLKSFYQYSNPLNYRIYIGWFGGVNIYFKPKRHEHR